MISDSEVARPVEHDDRFPLGTSRPVGGWDLKGQDNGQARLDGRWSVKERDKRLARMKAHDILAPTSTSIAHWAFTTPLNDSSMLTASAPLNAAPA